MTDGHIPNDLNALLRILQAVLDNHVPSTPPSDWAAVFRHAQAHGVDSYLYPFIRTWPEPVCPNPSTMNAWRLAFLQAVSDAARISEQTREMLQALHAEKIQVVPLKGIWLAEHVYDDPSARPMSDIDLLVNPDTFEQACRVLNDLGYAAHDPARGTRVHGQTKHSLLTRPNAALPVELHEELWCDQQPFVGPPDFRHVWNGLELSQLCGQPAWCFPLSRLWVYLAYHILWHGMAVPLRSYLDVVLLMRRYEKMLNADAIRAEAEAWSLPFAARFVPRVACDLFGCEVSSSEEKLLTPSDAHRKERSAAMMAALLSLQTHGENESILFSSFRQASRRQRIQIAWASAFLPPAKIRSDYPQGVRCFGLAGGYIQRMFDLIARRGLSLFDPSSRRKALDARDRDFFVRLQLITWMRAQNHPSR